MKEFSDLVTVMDRLRSECPWDKEQTLETLRKYLLEEAYECADALTQYTGNPSDKNFKELKEEMGDVLLQILFQAKILKEQKGGDVLSSVMAELKNKLVRRHPHVFKEQKELQSAEAVHQQWNEIKASEKPKSASLIDNIPGSFSAIMKAQKIGEKAQRADFDWNNADESWIDVESEWKELLEAETAAEKESEFGDLIFSLVQWGRHKGFDAEVAVAQTNERFLKRFREMERIAVSQGKTFMECSRPEKEALWAEAKRNLKKSGA